MPEVATDHRALGLPRPAAGAHVCLEAGRNPALDHDLLAADRLLTGEAGKAWRDSAHAVAKGLGVPIEAFTVGDDLHDPENAWTTAYGLDADGAVLVRPDAHVAWRRRSSIADPAVELERALRSMLGRA